MTPRFPFLALLNHLRKFQSLSSWSFFVSHPAFLLLKSIYGRALASARREMGVELKTAVVWDRFFGEDIRVRGDLRRADGDLCVAGTGFG